MLENNDLFKPNLPFLEAQGVLLEGLDQGILVRPHRTFHSCMNALKWSILDRNKYNIYIFSHSLRGKDLEEKNIKKRTTIRKNP